MSLLRRLARISSILAALIASDTRADDFCIALAETYFEQVYCELQARGESGSLPRFYEFRNNDGTTQALLLKRPASRLGISITIPRQDSRPRVAVPDRLPTESNQSRAAPAPPRGSGGPPASDTGPAVSVIGNSDATDLPDCRFAGDVIVCRDTTFRLTGNRNNQHLAEGALSPDNRLDLPSFSGSASSMAEVRSYLGQVYRRYIDKMLEIGLGGSTMTFGKFAFLFQDLTEKGVDFADRSETMFSYLKKDKGRIGVSEAVTAPTAIDLNNCNRLRTNLIACDGGRKNYLYVSN